MMYTLKQRLPPVDFPLVNCEELPHEPYIPDPVLEPRLSVESASSEPLQAKPSQTEPNTSSAPFPQLPTSVSFTALMGMEYPHANSTMRKFSKAVEATIGEVSVSQSLHELTRETAMPQIEEITPRLVDKARIPIEFEMLRVGEPIIEHPELTEQITTIGQIQTAKPQVEEQIVSIQSKVQITQEKIPRTRVSTNPEHIHSAEPPPPKVDLQEPLVPSGEEILGKV